MKFDTPAGNNPIDRQSVVGRPHTRIEGPLKTTGRAAYTYELHSVAPDYAYGYVLGAAIAQGRIASINLADAKAAPGVLAIVTHENGGPQGPGSFYQARFLGGPEVDHYHQAIAVVVAETFEQARAAAGLIRVDYTRAAGSYDLAAVRGAAVPAADVEDSVIGDFDAAFGSAPVTLDEVYTTPDQTHSMMEPHATIARWEGDRLTLWSASQKVTMGAKEVATRMQMPQDHIRLVSEYVGGAFGGKGAISADAVLAAMAARVAKRPVKLTLQRPLITNNTTHRPATIQRIRIGATRDGHITALGHDNWSGNIPKARAERATISTKSLYAGANRLLRDRVSRLHLPEGSSMRAPGETTGMATLEIAMDEMAEKLGMDPVAFRLANDAKTDPDHPGRPFSSRKFAECLRLGAERFGWDKRNPKAGVTREGNHLIGMGVASAIRGNHVSASGARIRLEPNGAIIVEADMTDMGVGSYTIVGQTTAEMLGVPLERVQVRLGDTNYPSTPGGGGQQGACSVTGGVYAAGMRMREMVAAKLGLDPATADFANGRVQASDRVFDLAEAAKTGPIVAEDRLEYGDLSKRFSQHVFGAHFAEVAVDIYTGEVTVRRMLAVCAAGRIINPVTARSQVIGAMTMAIGAALMEQLAVDKRFGFFVNHDMAGYEVPVHADVPHQEVIFLDGLDPIASPLKAKGVGELGICGAAAGIANALYHATGARVRSYPITIDRYFDRLPRPT